MKRVLSLMLSTIIAIIAITVPTQAALQDTSDIDISNFAISGPGGYRIIEESREKDNSSPMYLYIINSVYYATRVKALGTNHKPTTESYCYNKTCNYNGTTWYDYVTCARGVDYSIHSKVYEAGFDYGTLGFLNYNNGTQVIISGEWSVDSWNTHVDAVP